MRNFAWWHKILRHNVNKVQIDPWFWIYNCTDCDHMWKVEAR